MKKALFVLFLFFVLLHFTACKSTEESSQFTLTVTVGEGVSGTPESGTFTYTQNELVTYDYSSTAGYGNLNVTLDGTSVASGGTVTMNSNHTLNVTADIDVRGKWVGTHYTNQNYYMAATFSGDIFSGPVEVGSASVSGKGKGLFSVSGDQIDFTAQWSYVELTFNGTITGVNQMSGTWHIGSSVGGLKGLPKGLPLNGTWQLER